MYVALMWSDYHNLESSTSTKAFEAKEQAEAWLESYQDAVIGPLPPQDAKALVSAFRTLCDAAWTPNQSPEDRERNGKRINQANQVIDRLARGKLMG